MKKVETKYFEYEIAEDFCSLVSHFPFDNLIIIHQSDWDNPINQEFVHKVMPAIGLEVGSNTSLFFFKHGDVIRISEIAGHSIKKVVAFGIKPEYLSLHVEVMDHHWYQFSFCHLLFGRRLHEYSNESLKKSLWLELKKMYS